MAYCGGTGAAGGTAAGGLTPGGGHSHRKGMQVGLDGKTPFRLEDIGKTPFLGDILWWSPDENEWSQC